MKEKFNEKVIPIILKFINTKGIQSIKNGMVTSMSPLIIGSIFLILSNFPVKAVVDVLESTGIKAVLDQACGATFSISAMIAVIGISYSYAKLENQEPLNCAIISLASFLILMPSSITTESGEVVTGIINKTWTAGQGMIGAIIYPMDNITDFLYLIGSVFAPMIAIQIADFFILKRKDSLEVSLDVMNGVIWVIGFILYRILMNVDIPLGNTLPDMVITIVICILARKCIKTEK